VIRRRTTLINFSRWDNVRFHFMPLAVIMYKYRSHRRATSMSALEANQANPQKGEATPLSPLPAVKHLLAEFLIGHTTLGKRHRAAAGGERASTKQKRLANKQAQIAEIINASPAGELTPLQPELFLHEPQLPGMVGEHEAASFWAVEQFTEALHHTMLDELEPPLIRLDAIDETEISLAATSPVAIQIAERLAVLPPMEKRAVAPVIQDITAALRVARLARLHAAAPERILAAETQLAQLVMQLSEALHLMHSEEALRRCIRTLLSRTFMARIARLSPVELAHMGTHEIKLQFQEFFAMLAGLLTRLPTERLLGMFALFRAEPGLRPSLAPYMAIF
jgi:hypothetical protein